VKVRAWVTKGAIRLIAEEVSPQGKIPVEVLTEMEKDLLRGLCGRTFKAADYCNQPSSKKGTKKGTLEIYLTEVNINISES